MNTLVRITLKSSTMVGETFKYAYSQMVRITLKNNHHGFQMVKIAQNTHHGWENFQISIPLKRLNHTQILHQGWRNFQISVPSNL